MTNEDETSTEALSDGIAHLQAAAQEIVEALKAFGQAADAAVNDPEGAGAVLKRLADLGRAFVADLSEDDASS